MLNIKKILLPVDFPDTSLRVIHQAAVLARHFHSEIVMLCVVTARSHIAGVPQDPLKLAGWDMLAEIVARARNNLDQTLGPEMDGLTICRVLVKGDPTQAIVETAQREEADLIMMPSHGQTFCHFLLGSVTAKVAKWAPCPVWTGAHGEESPSQELTIRNILCTVDFNSRNQKPVSCAAQMAAAFGARLTLAHVTAAVELWGPGGNYVNRRWKEELVSDALQHIEELQQKMGIETEIFVGSGDARKLLGQAVKETKADLLVTGCHPYGGNLRTHGYATICAMPIPILSV